MSSKLIHSHKDFFTDMVVNAVLKLDQEDLNEKLIGVKRIPGGAMEVKSQYLYDLYVHIFYIS
jgi:T-complex protein 1 subunit eta